MSELRFENLHIPCSEPGPENPLPSLSRIPAQEAEPRPPAEGLTEDDVRYLGYGRVPGPLPYTIQDGYRRERVGRALPVATLENETLRATFLLGLGGRLWSLRHKPSGRELLAVNPEIQFANFAVRNAWFSGGVEWNASVPGHTPLTCAPLFAARLRDADGTPVLRMYEWERIRGVPYQIDVRLPDASPVLLVRVRIVNPHDAETPMYWWSNIAVPEREDVRLVAPADVALRHDYDGVLKRVPIPVFRGRDVSYASRVPGCADFFYRLPEGRWPWFAALDGEGRGLAQASTARLKGRKLFAWGQTAGGKRWQDFLACGGPHYMEIQAGLAPTQGHCLPMPPRAEWEWMEAYGLAEADPGVVHGDDWRAACRHVEERIRRGVTPEFLEAELARTAGTARTAPDDVVQTGAGWGALEDLRRSACEGARCGDPALPFGRDSLGPAQAPWRALLEGGAMPEQDLSLPPAAWMVQPEWRGLLERSLAAGAGRHAAGWLHAGVMRHYAGEFAAAREAYENSLGCSPSAWALRNLALLEAPDSDEAAGLFGRARQMAPECVPLAIETCRAFLAAGRASEALELTRSLPAHPRLRILRARAAFETGDLVTAEGILNDVPEIDDLREGETVLSDLWFDIQAHRVAEAEGIPNDDALGERVRRDLSPPPALDYRQVTVQDRDEAAGACDGRSVRTE